MGNINASNGGATATVPPVSVLSPEAPTLTDVKPSVDTNKKESVTNPGAFEELHKACKDIALQPFEGLRFMANKGLSSHFQVQHTMHLMSDKSQYRFGATYVGNKQISETEVFPVMVGEMDNSGNLQGQFIHQFKNGLKTKCIAQMQSSKFESIQLGFDYAMKDSTLSVVVADPDLLNGTGMMIAHYLQGITKNFSLGTELLFQKGAAREQAVVTLAGKYKTNDWAAAGSIGSAGLHASFYRKANENYQVGVEMEASLKTWDSVTSFAYQCDAPKLNMLFKGMITSEWTVGSSLEKKLLPLPITFMINGSYNLKKDKVAVGLGAVLG